MAKKRLPTNNNHVKEFSELLHELSYPKQYQIDAFRDFLVMTHIALANTVYGSQKLEDDYMEVAKRYNADELQKFAKMLAIATTALSEKHHDFLGEVFMSNEMGNSYRGQFFTPYHISSMMAQMTLGDINLMTKEKGWFALSEPTCGSGGMMIASSEAVTKAGFKPSEVMWVQAQDVDRLCFMMTYIQLSILDIPARVVLGNTLAMEEDKVLFTPSFILNGWDKKIANCEIKEKEKAEKAS